MSLVSMISLIPIGRPFNLPAFLFFQRLSASLACAIASVGSMKAQAPTSGSLFSICSKKHLHIFLKKALLSSSFRVL
jgi:hypothetical protein